MGGSKSKAICYFRAKDICFSKIVVVQLVVYDGRIPNFSWFFPYFPRLCIIAEMLPRVQCPFQLAEYMRMTSCSGILHKMGELWKNFQIYNFSSPNF